MVLFDNPERAILRIPLSSIGKSFVVDVEHLMARAACLRRRFAVRHGRARRRWLARTLVKAGASAEEIETAVEMLERRIGEASWERGLRQAAKAEAARVESHRRRPSVQRQAEHV